MVSAYIIILCFSALFAAYAFTRGALKISSMMGSKSRVPEGVYALVASLCFLIVVGAPAPLLVGALLLVGTSLVGIRHYLPPIALWGVPLLAALLALSQSVMPAMPHVPHVFMQLVAMAALFAIVMGAPHLGDDLQEGSLGLLAALMPLVLAPLLFRSAPSYLALDATLIAITLLGVLLAKRQGGTFGLARAPFALILGWLMIQAAIHGAWICALISLAIYGGMLARRFLKTDAARPHAS